MDNGNGNRTRPGGDGLVGAVRDAIEQRRYAFPLGVFSDPDLYALERDRVFRRSWVFLAHETEIPSPGDYVLRYVTDDSFIVARDEGGVVRVHLNACRHRGMQVCRAEMGNTSHFRCPYHGWTFKNSGELIGVPFYEAVYNGPDGLDKSAWSLLAPAKMAIRNGLIFVCLDEGAPEFDEFLGDFGWWFDWLTRKTEGGLVVVGPPQRWVSPCNWKMPAENFIGDSYHTPTSHRSTVEVGIIPLGDPNYRKEGCHWNAGPGGGGALKIPPGTYHAYPDEVAASMRAYLRSDYRRMVEELNYWPSGATLFPNLSFINVFAAIDETLPPIPYFSLRLWRPLSAGEIEVWSWFLVERDAPAWFQRASQQAYLLSFGSSGTLEQDDMENWSNISHVAKGSLAHDLTLNYGMGLDRDGTPQITPRTDWPGPGNAYPRSIAEFNQRHFWRTWSQYMTAGDAHPACVEEQR